MSKGDNLLPYRVLCVLHGLVLPGSGLPSRTKTESNNNNKIDTQQTHAYIHIREGGKEVGLSGTDSCERDAVSTRSNGYCARGCRVSVN